MIFLTVKFFTVIYNWCKLSLQILWNSFNPYIQAETTAVYSTVYFSGTFCQCVNI